jgi:hypothetical protein
MSRKIELLDLHDDVLFEIINKLDHESKKQMMATCKKFESLIGQEFQFYKDFKFRLYSHQIQQKFDFHHSCKNIQRKFGCVEYSSSIASNLDLEIASRVLPNAIKIQLGDLRVSRLELSNLMRCSSVVRELEICGLEICGLKVTDLFDDFEIQELPHLKRLEITDSEDLTPFTGLAPSSLKYLRLMGKQWLINQPIWNTGLLAKQKHLDELSLETFNIHYFRFDPQNKRIKKLFLCQLNFPNLMAFGGFKDFLKVQETVEELVLHFSEEELKRRDYAGSGIFTHLLSLKSLRKLVIGYETSNEIFTVLSKIQFCNPAVESLTIMDLHRGADLKFLPSFFPNVIQLKITWNPFRGPNNKNHFLNRFSMDLKPINSMKKIVEFEMDLTDGMMGELDLKQLKVFRITGNLGLMNFLDPELFGEDPLTRWRTFNNNNSQLEVLEMSEDAISFEFLRILLENLPLLRVLKSKVDHYNYGFFDRTDHPESSREENLARYEKEQGEIVARLLAEKYESLEELMLEIWDTAGQHLSEYLELHHPTLLKPIKPNVYNVVYKFVK